MCADRLEPGQLWAGIFGAGVCGTYNITAEYFTDDCENEMGGDSSDESTAVPLALEHVRRASCDAYQWVDFKVEVQSF